MQEKKTRKRRQYPLDDGTVVTVASVTEALGGNHSTNTVWNRLQKSTDPAFIYRKVLNTKGTKVYTLDDGTTWTTAALAKHLGIKRNTAGARLCVSSDPVKVLARLKRPDGSSEDELEIKRAISSRMYYDPDGFWSLFNKVA